MKVWWLDSHPVYNTVSFENWEDYEVAGELIRRVEPLTSKWEPYRVILKDKGQPSDFLAEVRGGLIVSEKVRDVFSQLPELHVEFLPLQSIQPYYVMNILTVLEGVDLHRSKKSEHSSPRMTEYEAYAFREDVVCGQDIFRIRLQEGGEPLREIFVSDRLYMLIEQHLTGYQLLEMWDSEFSWEQKEDQFNMLCEKVNKELVETFDFGKAIKYVKRNRGQVAYSGNWALKVDEDHEILLGNLEYDGSYTWIVPLYYPPIILGLIWGIKDKRSIGDRLKDLVPFL